MSFKAEQAYRKTCILLVSAALFIILVVGCSGNLVNTNTISPTISFKGLSSEVSGVNLHVTGPGINESQSFGPGTTLILLNLPQADDVLFDVEAPKISTINGAVISYGEAKVLDLRAGENINLTFVMGPYETKIVAAENWTNRVVQVTNMNISEFEPGPPDFITLFLESSPWDVTLDNQGRIWIGQDNIPDGLLRYDDITDTSPSYTSDDVFNATAVDFDKMNSYIYYVESYEGINIQRKAVSPTSVGPSEYFYPEIEPDVIGFYDRALAVDNAGFLYFFGGDAGERDALFKYDVTKPEGSRIVAKYNKDIVVPSDSYGCIDILAKMNLIYITNKDGAEGKKLLKFDKNLSLIQSYGTSTSDPDEEGAFFGPERFVATTGRKITLTDEIQESAGGNGDDRLVSLTDTDGISWDAYYMPQSCGGSDVFNFFHC